MDAISCVAPPALLSRSFGDAAIARALHFSLSDSPVPEPSSSIVAGLSGCSAAATTAPPAFRGPAVILPPQEAPSARCRLGPTPGGRVGKRRPRPSKCVPTTYISTDASNFRLMVQHVTGADAEPQDVDEGLGLLLPPFDVEPMLPSDRAAVAAHIAAYVLPPPATAAAEQPCFPTLDSWNVMYEKNEVV